MKKSGGKKAVPVHGTSPSVGHNAKMGSGFKFTQKEKGRISATKPARKGKK